MNTRLQVEHPVTEMVTGIDLVEQQLRVAAGEALALTQTGIAFDGCSIEVRVNAEDPAGGAFLPCPGPVTELRPAQGFATRWDGGYEAGDKVSPYYDNLIGKLVVWGRDRDIAIGRALRALSETHVAGVATTIPAAQAILAHADFAAVAHSTRWVEERLDLSGVTGKTDAEPPAAPDGDDLPRVRRDVVVEVDGKRFSVSAWVPETAPPNPASTGNAANTAARPRRASGGASAGTGTGQVTVPMQGTIVKILVEVGQEVTAGEGVVVLEAMKMENSINADRSGTVTEIKVEPGDTVGAGDVVVVVS